MGIYRRVGGWLARNPSGRITARMRTGGPVKDFDRFKLAMTQIVGKRLTWDRLTGKETESPTCLNC